MAVSARGRGSQPLPAGPGVHPTSRWQPPGLDVWILYLVTDSPVLAWIVRRVADRSAHRGGLHQGHRPLPRSADHPRMQWARPIGASGSRSFSASAPAGSLPGMTPTMQRGS
jgi:hypothetical protein